VLYLCADPVVMPGGEACKNDPALVEQIQRAVNDYGIDRHSYIAVIGGGALLDMAGFAAAVSHRGVRLIRIPTTVLAQNDSGVGVKNSVNAFHKKNFLGTFAPPFAVLNDFAFLATLDDRDWRAGISEAIKGSPHQGRRVFRTHPAGRPGPGRP
jgi:3-dehydroquinate synthase